MRVRQNERWVLAAIAVLLQPELPLAAQECTFDTSDWEGIGQEQQLGRLRRCLHDQNGVWLDNRGALWLQQAARHADDPLVILTLLQGGAGAVEANEDGWTALHIAAAHNRPSIITELLQWTLNPNVVIPGSGWTPLHLAAAYNSDPGAVKVLIEEGADQLAADYYGWRPVHVAAYFGGLQAGDSVPFLLSSRDAMELHRAALQRDVSAIERTVSGGGSVDVNEPDIAHWTALHFAAARGSVAVVNRLLELGAAVNAPDLRGYTALHFAAMNGATETVEALLANGADRHATAISLSGAEDGMTALHLAAQRSPRASVVRTLLSDDMGDVDQSTTLHWTAIHHAARQNRNVDVIKVLLDKSIRGVTAKAQDGSTPLHLAAQYNDLTVVNALLAAGADPIEPDATGRSPAHLAVRGGRSWQMIRRLVVSADSILFPDGPLRGENPYSDGRVQNILGYMYRNGLGVPKDDVEGTFWFRQAADGGDSRAQYNMGVAYRSGRGMPPDDHAVNDVVEAIC